ncbi:hypothetical protein HX866_32295 [Pseudomonas gingeri]|nr:hypothetical protein [Pseudomonas gingeri]
MPPIKEKKGQSTWLEQGLPDLRSAGPELRAKPPAEVSSGDDIASAIEIVARNLGFVDPAIRSMTIDTPVDVVTIYHRDIHHIVEKRAEARERYVRFALDTLVGPLEVWRVEYDDQSFRLAFIGLYEAKRQMLVVVDIQDGKRLWNFMHTDAKSLNKHRHGELLYKRYELF